MTVFHFPRPKVSSPNTTRITTSGSRRRSGSCSRKNHRGGVKPLLYVYRVLLTGIQLMRTGEVEANLVKLNDEFRLPYIADLVSRKLAGPEKSKLEDADIAFHESEYQRLRGELQAAHEASTLPELPSDETRAALNDLLIRVRLDSLRKSAV